MATSSPIPSPSTRLTALAGPALFALYGITRDLDGLDNNRGDGALWDVGHVAFFLSTMAFAVLATQLTRDVLGRQRGALTWVSTVALLVTLAGTYLLCWVLLMDLGVPVGSVPDAVVMIGPVLLGVGLVVLLLTQVGRQLPLWSPLTFLVADASVGFNLDLATPAGLIMTAALWPLVRQAGNQSRTIDVEPVDRLPASLWHRSPVRCVPRDQRAISIASRTVSVRIVGAARQPTIMRE